MLSISFVLECRRRKACLTTVWHSFQANNELKEEQRQAVLCLLGQKGVVAVLPTSIGKSLMYQLFATVKLKQNEKNVVLVAQPLRSIIND